MTKLDDVIFKAIYDNCNLPEARCKQITAEVVTAVEAWADEVVDDDYTG